MVIVDSSVWIDALRGTVNPHTDWLHRALGQGEIGLTSLTLCEVLQGVRSRSQFEGFRQDLVQLPVFEAITAHVAIESARNYLRLREQAITVRKTIDCLIATFCIESGYELLHRDRDFDSFESYLGLKVKHP
jgi:hypothetical protein